MKGMCGVLVRDKTEAGLVRLSLSRRGNGGLRHSVVVGGFLLHHWLPRVVGHSRATAPHQPVSATNPAQCRHPTQSVG